MFLAATSYGCLFFLPLASNGSSEASIYADSIYNISDHILLLILTVAGIGLALLSIFLFSNRKLQIKINYLGILISGILLAFAFFFQNNIGGSSFKIGFILPILATSMLLSANYFIGKDEKKVRSMDRLR